MLSWVIFYVSLCLGYVFNVQMEPMYFLPIWMVDIFSLSGCIHDALWLISLRIICIAQLYLHID